MKTSRIIPTTLAAMLVLVGANSLARAETLAQDVKPLELQNIMKELGRNMQIVTDGISRGDWALIEKTAPLIADHPQPPLLEKTRIIGFIGSDMGKFKSHDGKTHEAANALGLAARNGDGLGVIAAFQTLQTSCYSCHREFRKPFVEHFYGAR